jgi:hypothetical protein
MSDLLVIGVAVVMLLLGAFLLFARVERLWDLVDRDPQISVGQTKKNGSDVTNHADLIRSRWTELLGPIPVPAEHAGFLDVPPDLTGFLVQDDAPDTTPEFRLEVSGVQVGGALDAVLKLARPPIWQIDTHVIDVKNRLMARLELKRGSRSVRIWNVEHPPLGKTEFTIEDEQAILERAVFEMIHDIQNAKPGDKDLVDWQERLPKRLREEDKNLSGEALLAYRKGLLDFRRYYTSGDPKQLDSAVKSLRTLARLAPQHGDGLLLLGMVLIESRGESEIEAIQAFERYIKLKATSDPLKAKRAELLMSIARMRQYDASENHEAIGDLEKLSNALSKFEPANDSEEFTVQELHALAHVQLAHANALRLAFLRSEGFRVVTGSSTEPDAKDVAQRIDFIWNSHKTHLSDAHQLRGALNHKVPTQGKDPERRAERVKRLDFEIRLTTGYGLHRRAGWLPDPPEKRAAKEPVTYGSEQKDPESASEAFENAIKSLQEAELMLASHYLPAQYLGMVFAEPRYRALDRDKAGQHLQRSLVYLERAVSLNPTDYYGHELLAQARLRVAIERALVPDTMEIILAGIKSAEASGAKRTWGTAVPLLRAQLHQLKYELSTDEERAKMAGELERYVVRSALSRQRLHEDGETDPETEWVRLLIDVRSFGPADANATDEVFVGARDAFDARLKALIDRCNGLAEKTWSSEVRQRLHHIRKRAGELEESVNESSKRNWRSIPLPAQPYA